MPNFIVECSFPDGLATPFNDEGTQTLQLIRSSFANFFDKS
jgi:hypothetical protein